jgi:hypothetical protein
MTPASPERRAKTLALMMNPRVTKLPAPGHRQWYAPVPERKR